MANKTLNTRQQQKRDIEANWITAGNNGFVPKSGEIIVYSPYGSYNYTRIKIGDGQKNINSLPFFAAEISNEIDAKIAVALGEVEQALAEI